jgi:secreted PhoX family phosphatase
MPSVKNVTDNMVVDDAGNLWVETHEEKEEQGTTYTAYDIFNEDGIYEARVWLDVSQISLGLFKNGKMYTRETDEETGYGVFKRYRVIWRNREQS